MKRREHIGSAIPMKERKMMKKLTALSSVLALLLALSACSGQAGGTPSENVSPGSEAFSQAVSETPTRDIPPSEEPKPSAAPAEETEPPAPSEEPQPSDAVPETSAPTPTPEPAATPEPTSAADLKAIALELSERRAPVDELYAAIGYPISSDYAPGCVEPGSEDGELIYDGFTVYTVRTATEEYVFDVL